MKFNKHSYIFHAGDYYNVIESMGSHLNKSYYCNLCKEGFDHIEEHNCITICKACQRMNCKPDCQVKCQNCELINYSK